MKRPKLKLVTDRTKAKANALPFDGMTSLNINDLVPNPSDTLYLRVNGHSLEGISHGDLLIIERSLVPRAGDIVAHGTSTDDLTVGHYQPPSRLRDLSIQTEPDADEVPVYGVATYMIRSIKGSR